MPVNLSDIRDLLRPGLRKVTGKYRDIPKQWPQVFQSGKSDMAVERVVQMRYLGLAREKQEGGQTEFDNQSGQRWVYLQEHIEVALGFAITRKAIDDNQYKKDFNPNNMGLMKSFSDYQEIVAANILNTGNVYNTQVGGDGQPLFSTGHLVDQGSYANRPSTEMQLNEAALSSSTIQIRRFKNQAGLKIQARARKLVVPLELEPVACRLLKTKLRPGTADNDVSYLVETNAIPDGYISMDYLTSPYAWFVLSDQDGLQYLERVPYETDMHVQFTTDNLLVKGYQRYSFSYYEPMAAWGTFPTF